MDTVVPTDELPIRGGGYEYSRFIVSLILISSGDSDTDESFRASFCCGIMRSLFSDGWTCAFAQQSKKSSALAS
jgi:hypothetical protein